jgi:hypothetical protein
LLTNRRINSLAVMRLLTFIHEITKISIWKQILLYCFDLAFLQHGMPSWNSNISYWTGQRRRIIKKISLTYYVQARGRVTSRLQELWVMVVMAQHFIF